MSYKKQNFVSGQTLKAEHLNHMEDGIVNAGGIIDVVKLPTEDISESSFYRLLTAEFIDGREILDGWVCHCVNELPEVGEPVSTDMVNITAYYNVQDGEVYGYADDMISAAGGVPVGWYLIGVLGQAFGVSWGSVVDDIDNAPEGFVNVLLKYDFYLYKNNNKNGKSVTTIAKFILNQHFLLDDYSSNYVCRCVETLPEVGEVCTDANMSFILAYYNLADNGVYGYVDSDLGTLISVPAGWYAAEVLFGLSNKTFAGVVTDINDDPCDGAIRLLVNKSKDYNICAYDDSWMKLPFACEKTSNFDIQWDGVVGDQTFLDMGEGLRYVKVSDVVPTADEVREADIELFDISEVMSGKVTHDNFWLFTDENAKFNGAFNVAFNTGNSITDLLYIVYDVDAFASSLGAPTGVYTNGVYFMSAEDGSAYVSRLAKTTTKITKIDSKFIDADLSGYVTTSEVDTKINQAIGNAIGGSY